MDINKVTAVYFVGAGGIGMSALIRYFLAKGKRVGGYPFRFNRGVEKGGSRYSL